MALARQTFTGTGNFVAPAGVNAVNLIAKTTRNPLCYPFGSNWIDSAGTLYTFGQNSNGQIGNNSATAGFSTPQQVIGSISFVKIVSDSTANMAIDSQGRCWAWGNNASGQLGNGTQTATSSPILVQVPKLAQAIMQNNSVFGIDYSGKMWAWGYGLNGNLGTNASTNASVPTLVVGGLTWASATFNQGINANPTYALGITTSGTMYGMGKNANGQLGINNTTDVSSPVLVVGGLTTWSKVLAQGTTTVAMTSAGVLYAWGSNANGQLGVNDVNPRSSPTLVLGGLTFSDFVVGNGFVVGLTTAGTLYGWGINTLGQVGDGTNTARSSPVLVLGGLSTWSKIRCMGGALATYSSVVGITSAGVAYAWGRNDHGQLGVGDTTARSSPVLIAGGLTFADIAICNQNSNGDSMSGYTTAGAVYAWGNNTQGELGSGDTTPRSSPVLVTSNLFVLENDTQTVIQLPVTPGTTYAVTFGNNTVTFGGVPVGNNISSVVVQYEQ